jgi:hypothetical protein
MAALPALRLTLVFFAGVMPVTTHTVLVALGPSSARISGLAKSPAQILVTPPGALASVPDWLRCAAVAAGFAAFIAARRSTLVGVVCGEIVMLAGKWWLG